MADLATLIIGGMEFETVYRAHFPIVWRSLRRFGVSDKDAPDLTQEVFFTACRRFEDFEGRSSVKTWLIGIAYGLAANYRRRAARREVLSDEMVDGAPCGLDAERQLEQREDLKQLEGVLDALPLEQRAVFTMFEIEGLSGDEIADALAVPVGTVRSRLRLARAAFRAALGLDEPVPPPTPGEEP